MFTESASQTYRKKPVDVKAIQFWDMPDIIAGIIGWAAIYDVEITSVDTLLPMPGGGAIIHNLQIHTLEGVMTAKPGDWIVKGSVENEFWPVKQSIFETTYEAVEAADASAPLHIHGTGCASDYPTHW